MKIRSVLSVFWVALIIFVLHQHAYVSESDLKIQITAANGATAVMALGENK